MGSSHDFDELENCETVHFALGYVSENHDGELFPAHNSVSLSENFKELFSSTGKQFYILSVSMKLI